MASLPIALASTPFNVAFLYSLFLKAILFINDEGELRVSPEIDNSVPYNTKEFLKHCEIVNTGIEHCVYISGSKKFILAMRRESGMLAAIPTPDALPAFPDSTSSPYCVWFEEKASKENNAIVRNITGCLSSTRHQLAMNGVRLEKQGCRHAASLHYSQTARKHIRKAKMAQFTTLGLPSAARDSERKRKAAVSKKLAQCASLIRPSYPLNWSC
eukprot:scpid98708/ scgid22715/ 